MHLVIVPPEVKEVVGGVPATLFHAVDTEVKGWKDAIKVVTTFVPNFATIVVPATGVLFA